ncbi:MAG: SDR family oxidoreductase [Deltaproteobacteria bacterium]|nr:SDR family oxidoreductase [Deltaproteobacteria bacterium]
MGLQEILNLPLVHKVAIVTGGGTGIGKAIGVNLARNGARVAIASRNPEHLEAAKTDFKKLGLSVFALPMDQKEEIQRAVAQVADQCGAIHILVNNAGISGLSRLDDPEDGKWFNILDTNLSGMYLITKEVLRHIKDHSGGRIINISSVLGKFGVAGYAAYCTTKHGVIGFTRALALEVVNRGITVNTVCPGWVNTEMARQGIDESAAHQGITPEQFREQAVAGVPIKRFLEPDEIAELVCYLASDLAKGITGQAINICGGQTML